MLSQDSSDGFEDPRADKMRLVNPGESKMEKFKLFVTKRQHPFLPNFTTTKYIPSNVMLRYLDLFDSLLDFLQLMSPKKIIEVLKSIMASNVHGINCFSTEFIRILERFTSSTSLLRVVFPYTHWYDHCIIKELVEASGYPEGIKLLSEFDSRIDETLPITSYPIPTPSDLMVPDESSAHTVMAVRCEQQLPSLSLHDIGVVKSLLIDKFDVTEHAFVLLAVADHSTAMFFWLIPRSIVSIITKAAQEQSISLYENGLLEVAIYPSFSFSTGSTSRVWTMAYQNDTVTMFENEKMKADKFEEDLSKTTAELTFTKGELKSLEDEQLLKEHKLTELKKKNISLVDIQTKTKLQVKSLETELSKSLQRIKELEEEIKLQKLKVDDDDEIKRIDKGKQTDEGKRTDDEGTQEFQKPFFSFVLPDGKKLREYQKELAAPGLDGQNYIVCAPTGTGKTLVASMVISDHLKKNPSGRVLFLVNRIALAEQQCKEVRSYVSGLKAVYITSWTKAPPMLMYVDNQMIVSTPGTLLNEFAMQSLSSQKRMSLSDVTLLIVDECHDIKENTPYYTIMENYIRNKLEYSGNLPQVVGLTASLGAGDNPLGEMEKAVHHLLSLCALLDASGGIKIVKENTMELLNYTSQSDFELIKTKSRSESDTFLLLLNSTMDSLEQQIQTQFGISKCTMSRFSDNYDGWITQQLQRHTGPANIELQIRLKYLQYYHNALNLYQDLTQDDVVALLKEKINNLTVEQPTAHTQSLHLMFDRFCQQAQRITPIDNPKLIALKQLLIDHYQASPSTHGIIFVTTKDRANFVCQWLKDSAELMGLVFPIVVTGRGDRETGAMTAQRQQDIIKKFSEGVYNLLISTAALVQGINVPACNLMIRYNYVINEITHVQTQGRAQAVGSHCYTILEESSPKIQKEALNKDKGDLMVKAIAYLPEGDKLKQEIKTRQEELLSARDLQQKMQKESKKLLSSEVTIACKQCDNQLCWGGDLRVLAEKHRVVITKDIFNKCTLKIHDNSRQEGDFYISQKVYCNECGQDLGVTMRWPEKGVEFPALKCPSLKFSTPRGKVSVKQWSKVPFSIQDYM